ncbi:hypothetical protein N7445_008094 [Penicillium cf. griseofulvum]|nr:hypothetical protein N7445_008094 [Penicillium cf. griseofulvum]
MLQIKFSLNANHYGEQGSFGCLPGENAEQEVGLTLHSRRSPYLSKLQSMLPVETVISLYERIQADAVFIIDYKVKHNSSEQFFLSAIDGSPNQGHLAVLLDSVILPNDESLSSDVSLDTRTQYFSNDFDEHHPDGPNINSPNNSDVTSHDSAIDLNDGHQYTSTRPGSSKALDTRYTKNETLIRSVSLTSPTIGRLERSTKVTSEEIESRGATPERFRQSSSRLQPTVEGVPDKDEIAAVNPIGSDDISTNITGIDLAQSGIQIPSSERYSLESQQRADYAPGNARGSDPDDCSISNESFKESDLDLAIGDSMRFLSEDENPVDFTSNPQGRIFTSISPSLNNNGLSALPKKLSDTSHLPLPIGGFQASSKRKLSLAVESQSDQSSRNLRSRFAPEQSEEPEQPSLAVEDCEPNEPDILESVYSQLTLQQLTEVHRTGKGLHSHNLEAF